MKAAPAVQLRLLDLQAIDTARNQLAHRRATLPELAELVRLVEEAGSADAGLTSVRERIGELDGKIRTLEREVDSVRGRAQRDIARMDAGSVTSARELESMQHEVRTLAAKQSELEDRELELMEQREIVAAELDTAAGLLQRLRADHAAAVARRDVAYGQIDIDDARYAAERAELVAQLPVELVELYERLRATYAGVGAAALRAKRCQGCRLELFGTALVDLAAAPEDDVVRCDECGRILVRTSESGL